MNEMVYAQKFVELINGHEEYELAPLISGMYLALVATSLESGMSEESIHLNVERAIEYCKERLIDSTRH